MRYAAGNAWTDLDRDWRRTGKRREKTGEYGKAYDCFQRAAEQGDLQAMFNLGEYFREGKAQEKDLDKAAKWYRKALDAGYQPKEEEQEILKAVLGDSYTQMLE